MIDYEDLNRTLGRFEFQTELFLEGVAYRWCGIGFRRLARIWSCGIWEPGESIVNGEFQMKREFSCEPGFIDHLSA